MERPLPHYRHCFVCGDTRLGRLGVRFKEVNGKVKASFKLSEKYVGYPDVVHGGILTALLDEAMVWSVFASTGKFSVSAEITVRFLKPAPIGHQLEIIGYLVRQQKNFYEVIGEIQDADAVIYAKSWGRLITLPPEENQRLLNKLQQGK